MAINSENEWRALARDFVERVKHHSPEWTEQLDNDPGITLLQLFSFLAAELVSRSHRFPEREGAKLSTIIQQLATLREQVQLKPANLTRVRYFTGKLLTADDFQTEQAYFREKLRRHNLWLHGAGIVSGLHVTVERSPSNEHTVLVRPGLAIGVDGEELFISEPLQEGRLPDASWCYVTLTRVDIPVQSNGEMQISEPSRMEEHVGLEFNHDFPPHGLAIARLERKDSGWSVDSRFKRPQST
jgi:hypothetical protein